jgi:hypothetical protein
MKNPTTLTQTVVRLMVLWWVCAMPAAMAAVLQKGTWTGLVRDNELQLNLREPSDEKERGFSNLGFSVALSAFKNLSTAEGANAIFQLVREAGAFTFEGRFSDGQGAGHYRFEPNDGYLQSMAALGYKDIRSREQYQLAIFDIGPARVKELASLGFNQVPLKQLVETGIFNVTPEYVRAMSQLGFGKLTLKELVESRIHNLTPEFIRSLEAVGYKGLDFETLKSLGIHGVRPEFIREIRGLGFQDISLKQLLAFRIHGVSPDFIREMRDSGFPNATADDLVKLRIHGIDSTFVRSMKRADGGSRK